MRWRSTCFLLIVLTNAAALYAADLPWPRWRGPHDDGSVAEGEYPANLLEKKFVQWKIKLDGIGCSTPAVLNDRIFVTGPVDGHNGVIALDWQGKEQWRTKLAGERRGKHRNGSAANSSPVTDGNLLFAYFKSGELAALDLSGKILWTTNLQERFAKDTLYWDIGTSPVLTEKAVVVAVMHSGESYLAAFEKASGELLWKVSRNYKTPVEGDHSYATPIVINRDGQEQILVWGAEHLTIHSTTDGKMLFECGGFNPDRKGNWVQVASAIVSGDMAVVPYGRGAKIAGIKLTGSGDVTATNRVWTRDDLGSFVPSPAAHQGKVYVVRDEGEVVCLDIKTGETVWTDRFPRNRNKYYASPLIAGGKLYAPREDGVVFVADIRDGFKLLSENDMGERIIASPVAVQGNLLIRGEENLTCLSLTNGKKLDIFKMRCLSLIACLCFALSSSFALAQSITAETVASKVQPKANDGKLRIIVFGAHPDDAEFKAGGSAALWAKKGHHVKLVSVTNGDIGHWQMAGGPLAKRRTAEAKAANAKLGSTSQVLDIHDGELLPTLEHRQTICRLIREWRADIVIAHRPWDYHPDHRYVGVLVQDAAFMVTVPFFCPDVPPLANNPVFLYSSDGFQKPYPFRPDVVVAVDDVFEQKIDAIHELTSQVYEGGASGNEEFVRNVPPERDVAGRKAWLREKWEDRQSREAEKFRDQLIKLYGEERGKQVKFAESFELCEYGRRPSPEELKKLFPFFD